LFQAHYHIYSHVEKYANEKTVLANHRQQWRRNFPITLYAAVNTPSSMTKGETAELTDLAFAAGDVG